MRLRKLLWSSALAILLTARLAEAQVVPSQTEEGVRFASGGVGAEEAAAMRAAASDYSLEILFASRQGAHLSGVEVRIARTDGAEVLDTTSQGPMLLVDLPPGTYTLEASVGGASQTRRFTVADDTRSRLDLRWDAP